MKHITLKKLFDLQRTYNQKIFGDEKKSAADLEKHTQELALCSHAEISSLISATTYKKHHKNERYDDPDGRKILYESVDVIRYIIAILNLWEIDDLDFQDAFLKKDNYLDIKMKISNSKWSGQPVAIVDMDDVIADFRKGFSKWLKDEHGVIADVASNRYYFIDALKDSGLNPEKIFMTFVNSGGFSSLPVADGAKEFLSGLKEKGYWIQILTARPEENLQCLYDTYWWLNNNDIQFDDVAFSSEKFRWCAQSKYYDSDSIAFAIDDSPKHASEYAKHDILCYVPKKSYNKEVWNKTNITTYDSFDKFFQLFD